MVRILLTLGVVLGGCAALAFAQAPPATPPPCEERLHTSELRRSVGDQIEGKYAAEVSRLAAELTRLQQEFNQYRLDAPALPGSPAAPTTPRKKGRP